MEDRNTFEVIGTLVSAEEVSYGSDGKSLANIVIETEVRDYNGDPEMVEVVFGVFGRDKDKVLNTGPGARIKVNGHLSSRRGTNGGIFLGSSISKLSISGGGQGAVDKPRTRQAQPARQQAGQRWQQQPDDDDIPF